ncbi:MAG: dienelactone hydrolase family protein [Burkholderiales bacterium]
MRHLLTAVALAATVTAHAALPAAERVSFPSLDRDANGAPVMIDALFFKPPDTTGGKVPLVVALHGCGGMYSASASRRDQLSERGIAWTEALLADGYAVLWPDSFNPRGRRSVCLVRRGEPTIAPATRRLDVLGALAFGTAQPGIDRTRAAIVGWSHGGSTTLATVNGKDPAIEAFYAAPGAPPPFVAAVAFYPGCVVSLREGAGWLPMMPLRIDTGELDDWTPSSFCVRLGDSARLRGATMDVTVYPGAYHGFDAPTGKVVLWKQVTTGAKPTEGVHVGPDPAAREAATTAVRAFLRARFAPAATTTK